MIVEMRTWQAEVKNTPEENDLLIKGVAGELRDMAEEGATSVLVGGDTLIFGAVDAGGKVVIYECTIRRANVDSEHDLTPTPEDGPVLH